MQLSQSVAVERHEEPGLGVVGAIWIDNPPVNALSQHVREGLAAAVPAVADHPEMQAAVLVCRGRTFIAGADIREFGKPRLPPDTNEVRRMIEKSPKPFVAAIHGTALGGGLEMAMACHFRVADTKARLGLPEVKLGILPGGGGTQRLPRLVGVPRALEMITSGEHITAAEALELGLVDAVADSDEEGGLAAGAFRFALRAVAQGRGLPRVRDIESHRAAVRENPRHLRRFQASDRPQDARVQCPRGLHSMRRSGGRAAVRRGARPRGRAVADPPCRPAVAGTALLLLRRARGAQDSRHSRRHNGPGHSPRRRARRRHDGRRHLDGLRQRRVSGIDRRAEPRRSRPGSGHGAEQLRTQRGARTLHGRPGRGTNDAARRRHGPGRDRRVRPRDRGRVRGHGTEEARLRPARPDRKAGRAAGHEHLLPGRQRDRRRHRPARGCRRHALLQSRRTS